MSTDETGWVHIGRGWIEPHAAAPDPSNEFRQPGTGNRTAPCLACGTGEAVMLPESAPEDWPEPFAPGETREALTAMVREGEGAGMYAPDHGAAGFCTDHGRAALDVDAIRARAIHDLDNLPAKSRPAWYRTRVNGDDAWWESLVQTECEVGHVVYVDDGDGTVYACPACALAARDAEVDRLRAVGPIAWTFGQQARADRAEAREAALAATVARVEALLPPKGRPHLSKGPAHDLRAALHPKGTDDE